MILKEYEIKDGSIMVEGQLFNWQKKSVYYNKNKPYSYFININHSALIDEGKKESYIAAYFEDKHELSLFKIGYGTTFLIFFYCETIYDAEKIIQSFLIGNKISLEGTIYSKV